MVDDAVLATLCLEIMDGKAAATGVMVVLTADQSLAVALERVSPPCMYRRCMR